MIDDNDIVADVFTQVRPILVSYFGEGILSKLDEIERAVYRDWAGETTYIRKNKRQREVHQEALERWRRGETVKQVIAKTGISRSSIYRLLKNRSGNK